MHDSTSPRRLKTPPGPEAPARGARTHTWRTRSMVLALAMSGNLCVSTACSQADPPPQDALTPAPAAESDLVLTATDLLPLSEFETQAMARETLIGTYRNEQGGAVGELSISSASSADEVQLHRVFREAGLPADVREATLTLREGEARTSTIRLRSVAGGVVLLETDGTPEGLPQDLWIYYPRTDDPAKAGHQGNR